MDLVNDVKTNKCVNHEIDDRKIISTIFNIYNPCSYCKNRKVHGKDEFAFYNKEKGAWDFPFVVESNCQNFARTITKRGIIIYENPKSIVNEIHFIEMRNSTFGHKFKQNFFEVRESDLNGITCNGENILPQKVIYPNGLSGSEFHKDLIKSKENLALLLQLLEMSHSKIYQDFHIRASNIENFVLRTTRNMELLERQLNILTDHLAQNRNRPVSVVQLLKFVISTAAGGSTWDSMKFIIQRLIFIVQSI